MLLVRPFIVLNHILTSPVIKCWRDARQHGIYLLSTRLSSESQGQLVGMIECSWWKFTIRSRLAAPGSSRMVPDSMVDKYWLSIACMPGVWRERENYYNKCNKARERWWNEMKIPLTLDVIYPPFIRNERLNLWIFFSLRSRRRKG